jgi:hypothetical protein
MQLKLRNNTQINELKRGISVQIGLVVMFSPYYIILIYIIVVVIVFALYSLCIVCPLLFV